MTTADDTPPTCASTARIHLQVAAAMTMAAKALGFSISMNAVLSMLTDGKDHISGPDILGYRQSARRFGLNMDVLSPKKVTAMSVESPIIRIDSSNIEHPVLLILSRQSGGSVLVFDDNGGVSKDPEDGKGIFEVLLDDKNNNVVWLRAGRKVFSSSRLMSMIDLFRKDHELSWLRQAIMNERSAYSHAIMASIVVAVFGLITPMFSMVVYNTIAPKAALNTLTTLAVGIAIVMFFDFIIKEVRSAMIDKTARRLDVILSRSIYEHQLNLRFEHQTNPAGTQADMLRGYTTVQEFFTSAVLLSLVDLPLSLLALGLIAYIGGELALVTVIGIVLMLLLNLLLQGPMERASKLSTIQGQERHGTLVETIIAAESIRGVGAERTMRRRWRDQVSVSAISAHKMRSLQQLATNGTSFIMQSTNIVMLIVGAILITESLLSVGALIAVSLLNSRVMQPFSQLAGLLARLYHTKTALEFLTKFMKTPQVRDNNKKFISRTNLEGAIYVENADFRYPAGAQAFVHALKAVSVRFNPRESVAILGRNGSGKSTLLKLIAGVSAPETGTIYIDGVDIQQIDPTEVRNLIGYVQQEPLLFSGTLRENLVAGCPDADDETLIRAATESGVDKFARIHPEGYDMHLGERGSGLSTGQKQAVAIAQALIRNPQVLLLDEPTSSLDPSAEGELLAILAAMSKSRTLIIVTHRPAVLSMVSRIVVIDAGKIVLDKPREQALKMLTNNIQANNLK